jgi:hypothetical protein
MTQVLHHAQIIFYLLHVGKRWTGFKYTMIPREVPNPNAGAVTGAFTISDDLEAVTPTLVKTQQLARDYILARIHILAQARNTQHPTAK